jgi:alkyl hydroperoxide reductase subunit D
VIRNAKRAVARRSDGAQTAAALMGMNNIWYPYVEMAEDRIWRASRPDCA